MTPAPPGKAARLPERHVVLVAPEVHWNTGNIGRTCLGVGATLHLVRPLGFSLRSREIKRAGLDYWPQVSLCVWESFEAFDTALAPAAHEVALFSKSAPRSFWQLQPASRLFLVFGSETRGLALAIRHRFPERLFHIPIRGDIRSLNLSTAAGIALYESLRGLPDWHAWPVDAAPGPSHQD
jgi:tRNA (cytidine/uridine-2'-O-)-methyltransferase